MDDPIKYEELEKLYTLAIYGDIGTGKTSLAYKIIDVLKKKRDVYFIKHPKPGLIKKMGYKNLFSLEPMERIENAVVYIDEPQLWISINDNKTNWIIAKICSLARQKSLKLIISSSDTRVFTKHNEAYFDAWFIKNVDYSMVKNGSKVKNIIKEAATLDPAGFRLFQNEYVFWGKKTEELNGRHTFTQLKTFTEEHSKPYRMGK